MPLCKMLNQGFEESRRMGSIAESKRPTCEMLSHRYEESAHDVLDRQIQGGRHAKWLAADTRSLCTICSIAESEELMCKMLSCGYKESEYNMLNRQIRAADVRHA